MQLKDYSQTLLYNPRSYIITYFTYLTFRINIARVTCQQYLKSRLTTTTTSTTTTSTAMPTTIWNRYTSIFSVDTKMNPSMNTEPVIQEVVNVTSGEIIFEKVETKQSVPPDAITAGLAGVSQEEEVGVGTSFWSMFKIPSFLKS